MSRCRGFAPWAPQRRTRELLDAVQVVLATYAEHLPLTIRQIFYRLVAIAGYEKSEAGYDRLAEALNRARRAGLMSWDAIRDDGVTRFEPNTWGDADEYLEAVEREAASLRMDRQDGQPVRLWLLCEAAGMAPMLARVAGPFGVPVLASGGFDSVTSKHHLARELAYFHRTEILHIGDHDPSGVHLFSALAEDVGAMVEALGGNPPTFTRLAVTPEQIADLDLPTAPAKASDRRSFTGETVQAEAIPPDVLATIVTDAIVSRQDGNVRAETLAREVDMRADVIERLRGEW
jgi:hypothetical protein